MRNINPPRRVGGRRLALIPRAGPQFGPATIPLIETLLAETLAETNGRDRFAAATHADFRMAAETFVRYRLTSLNVIRQTDAAARRMFLSDLRELGRRSFPEMQLAMLMLGHFTPQLAKQRTSSKDPLFEEVVLPGRLRNYTADLSSLGALLKPNQPMANYISRELARGKLQVPQYTPYIVPGLSESPWPLPIADHSAIITRWRGIRQAGKMPKNLHLPFSDWALYRLRFIFTADICGAWSSFGGVAAQLNALSAVLNIAVTDNIQAALTYGHLLSSHLGELARSRVERSDGRFDFASLLSNEQLRFKQQALAQTAASSASDKPLGKEKVKKEKLKQEKEKGEKKKKEKKQWLPRKEFLALLGERRQQAPPSPSRKRSRPPSRARSNKRRTPARRSKQRRSTRRSNPRRPTPKREAMKRQKRRN